MKNALEDEEFQKELSLQRELYEDKKEANERAYKIWLREKQRAWMREESSRRVENERNREELRMFFKDWPLQIAVEGVNDMRKEAVGRLPMNIVIAKHSEGDTNDPVSKEYNTIVDQVQVCLKDFGLDESRVNVYRFKDSSQITGGPAIANIYSMMSTLPTVVIQPKIDRVNRKFKLHIACWNQDSLFPLQKVNLIGLDYDTLLMDMDRGYLELKKKEIFYTCMTLAMVFVDTYSLVEGYGEELAFPKFALKYNISESYPLLTGFAKREYSSLLSNEEILERDIDEVVKVDDYINNTLFDQIRRKVEEALKQF